MEVVIQKTTEDAVNLTARLISDLVLQKPNCTLGLATGRTMEAVYDRVAELYSQQKIDYSNVTTFNLDEYIGLPSENVNSYRYYMNKHLFDRINVKKENTNLPNGMATDEAAEGERYEKLIASAGGIDLQLLGIGNDGHIAFNEPGSSLMSRTRAKSLTPITIKVNSTLFDPPESMPYRAFTMGVGTILDARSIIMLITGAGKAEIAARAIEGSISSMVTATALQLHPKTVVIVDEAAAARLTQKEYYNWIFQNEPKWKPYR